MIFLSGLESPEDSSEKYKCLIHTRDWNAGEMIPDQIMHSVESSRRTIIVLSKPYIQSMWTKLEFRAAHTQALQDKTQRVIIIVKGELPEMDSLDEDLQKYISLNTHLNTSDPWFWPRLRQGKIVKTVIGLTFHCCPRYLLPHRGRRRRTRKSKVCQDKQVLIHSHSQVRTCQ